MQNNSANKLLPRKKQSHAERKIHWQADIMYRNAFKKDTGKQTYRKQADKQTRIGHNCYFVAGKKTKMCAVLPES